ncbi:hypothetical protein RHGRI_022622 [Rhododendron griersonianum]|uniref:ferredoxin--NADP(+) reductase n=1 Tax=Rhododendron griersonianum TaxID=479676 RepID=A0AAV6J4U2_9ERIC|nr:hypothetical protein RHGRI_022622 [Rhododendron griersonianum]
MTQLSDDGSTKRGLPSSLALNLAAKGVDLDPGVFNDKSTYRKDVVSDLKPNTVLAEGDRSTTCQDVNCMSSKTNNFPAKTLQEKALKRGLHSFVNYCTASEETDEGSPLKNQKHGVHQVGNGTNSGMTHKRVMPKEDKVSKEIGQATKVTSGTGSPSVEIVELLAKNRHERRRLEAENAKENTLCMSKKTNNVTDSEISEVICFRDKEMLRYPLGHKMLKPQSNAVGGMSAASRSVVLEPVEESIAYFAHLKQTLSAAVSLPSSKSTSLSTRASVINFKVSFPYRNVSSGGKVFSVRAQVTTEAPAKVEKVSKKMEEGVVVNKYRPKDPYIGRCLLNTKITGDDAPGETWHMVFTTEGEVPYREGQSIGVIADGEDKNGKPHKLRLYSIASSALGDFGDSKTVSLCVKRLVYTNDQGEIVKGVCSNFLCDLKPGNDVKITGPVGKEMLMPIDPTATVIMLATGTGIAPFRSFLWKMLFEKHDDYKFNGLAWLFLGVPTSSSLLYKEEFEKMKEKAPDNFRLDFAVSREQTNEKGEKMYIQTRMAQYAEELWELLKKDNTYVYMCGLKGMEKGIDDIMLSLAAKDGIDWMDYKKQLKRGGQWNVEVY